MSTRADSEPRADALRKAIEHAAHLLPAQGPITVFIHHNTLHALEDLSFERAAEQGAQVFGCQPYLSESEYRRALSTGRIRSDDLLTVLENDLGMKAFDGVARLISRIDLRLAMLQYPFRTGPPEELLWFVAMTDALRRVRSVASVAAKQKLIAESRRWVMRDLRSWQGRNGPDPGPSWVAELFERFHASNIENWDEPTWEAFALEMLWRVCREGVCKVKERASPTSLPIRHRDLLLRATGTDIDLQVNPILIRFCSSFLDQGIAHWPLPNRENGFFHAFATLYRQPGLPDRWMRHLRPELAKLQDSGTNPLDSILESLADLGIPEAEWDAFIQRTFLALPGWAGMIHQIEVRGDRVARPIAQESLFEYLAVRLILERVALSHFAKELLGYVAPLASLRDDLVDRLTVQAKPSEEQRAFVIFQLAQTFGWSPNQLHHKTPEQWSELVREIEEFNSIERRRVLHAAFEKRVSDQALDALSLHVARPMTTRPSFQVITCLDEREESFRRHLEEVDPRCETYATAGFFGVGMYYRGAAEAHFVPLCPIAIRPSHFVEEYFDEGGSQTRNRQSLRRAVGKAIHSIHVGTRGIFVGALLTAMLGVLAAIPLLVRTLFPRIAAKIGSRLARMVHALPRTRLRLERNDLEHEPQTSQLGYGINEMAEIAERQLREIGLTRSFARLVLVTGHGSRSLNNPHESAYDCGACGGSEGGANARAFAQILNNPSVRSVLAERGLMIPSDTWFIGSLHNTCNDTVHYFDLDLLPDTHRIDFSQAQASVEQALAQNAQERARRFGSASLSITATEARSHVENRAEDLAQARPELGHATNAICVIARRERTRGLFLDRRAFLVSYDPTQDDAEHTILARVLGAVVPVCAGINLEYYFSRVDTNGWGSGTKLAHNIASLVGVMDGAASDLRTGLPWQMTELHEPVRLLMVVEATAAAMLRLMARDEAMGRLVRNGWIRLAVLDPHSSQVEHFERGKFFPYAPTAERLPAAVTSMDWFRGWRDHLEFAEVGSADTVPHFVSG